MSSCLLHGEIIRWNPTATHIIDSCHHRQPPPVLLLPTILGGSAHESMDEQPSSSVAIEHQNICRQQQQQQHQRQQFASAPACLAPTLRGNGAPDSPSADNSKRGSRSVSDRRARVGGGSSPLVVSNGRVGQPFSALSCSSMAIAGRRASSGGRRMPGMVRKSLQVRALYHYYCCM